MVQNLDILITVGGSMNPLDRIQANYETFTKTEQEIAIYILNHPLETARKPIVDVAKSSHSSKTALIRFSQKIGYSGFSEFRFDLSRSLIRSNDQDENIKSESIIDAVSNAYISCIQEFKSYIMQEDLDKVTQKMISAKRLKLIGYDRTFIPALQLRRRLAKIGYDAEAIDDFALMKDMPEILNQDDLIILFTIKDTSKSYSVIVQEAYASHIPVVCFTMAKNLPFKKYCDTYVVLPNVANNTEYSFLDNQAIFLIVVEMLLETIAHHSNQSK